MLHSHSPLPREPFHLKQSVVETVRTLPTTIMYMAAATLVSSLRAIAALASCPPGAVRKTRRAGKPHPDLLSGSY